MLQLTISGLSINFQFGKEKTRPVTRQDSSPDITHFVSRKFQVCDLDFDMTLVGGGGVGGIALCKIFIKPKMNQTGAKVGNNEVLKT